MMKNVSGEYQIVRTVMGEKIDARVRLKIGGSQISKTQISLSTVLPVPLVEEERDRRDSNAFLIGEKEDMVSSVDSVSVDTSYTILRHDGVSGICVSGLFTSE